MKADLGVSPVASLGYTLALITSMSLGVATFLSNILFIVIQIIVTKKFEIKNYLVQLIVAFIVSAFLDLTVNLAQVLPDANTIFMQAFYLILSLFIIAFAVFLYLLSRLPMMPYDTLIPTISKQYNITFSKTKVMCDVLTVIIALVLCMIFLQSWGSIGIGTLIAALVIGRILGVIMNRFSKPLVTWINNNDLDSKEEIKEKQI